MAETEQSQQGQFDELVSALGAEIGRRYGVSDEARPYRRMVDYLNPPPGGS